MSDLQKLILKRVLALGKIAMTAHTDRYKWRETPLSDMEHSELNVTHHDALSEQHSWIVAMLDNAEELKQ